MSGPGAYHRPVIAIDIGGTTLTIAEVRSDGSVRDPVTIDSPARIHGDEVVTRIRELVETRWPHPCRIGVGAAGVVDPVSGSIGRASDSFQGWTGYPLRERLEQAIGVKVQVENDVNAFLIGERRFGAATGERDCLGVMLGTGVGGAVILDGQVIRGRRGAAAEIGHMPVLGNDRCSCGVPGHLESLTGGRAIARRWAAATGRDPKTVDGAREVARRAANGDAAAPRIFAEAGKALGIALVQAATLFDLSTVIVGGGVSRAWQWLSPGLHDVLAAYPLISGTELRVRLASLSERAVLMGAASLGACGDQWKKPC
ncbi:ROK family protein [Cutibacterium sp. WCA-380-WT-3A]|uniref:ROK family protein n=1 Tax=Cutibacterium porci TaxID=2605781 RepID=A0A7K0J8L1_9ACTN|nr:ROK family protein [Cutibacterium porci]MSS46296.1 ROK family protein [Cutibacterium porci]